MLLFSKKDKAQILAESSLSLKLENFCLREWYLDFNPETQNMTNTQLWVRLYLH